MSQRDELRKEIFKSRKPDAKIVELFGTEVELKQPTLREVMETREQYSGAEAAARMIINYCFVPGTKERVFEDTDVDAIMNWPFGKDVMRIQNAIAELSNIKVDLAETKEELLGNPPEETSSQ